jgi:hypothetical protein
MMPKLEKCTKGAQNEPNGYKIPQNGSNIPNGHKLYQLFPIYGPQHLPELGILV